MSDRFDLERDILGDALLRPLALEDAAEVLEYGEAFHEPVHRRLWLQLLEVYGEGGDVTDPDTWLALDTSEVGGMAGLVEIMTDVPGDGAWTMGNARKLVKLHEEGQRV